jgi:tetratricopeptide (TPR) repeat protein
MGDYAGVLKTLSRFIHSEAPLPLGRAVASLAYSSLGDRKRAVDMARRAASDLEAEMKSGPIGSGKDEPLWPADSIIVERALGAAGLHKAVLDLHSRLPEPRHHLSLLCAGIAAFNLGQFRMARETWRSISAPALGFASQCWAAVAEMADEGLVPPFELSYDMPPDIEDDEDVGLPSSPSPAHDQDVDELESQLVMLGLYEVFRTIEPDRHDLLFGLIISGGGWGERLARQALAAPGVAISLKMTAIDALVAVDRVKLGQRVRLTHDGREINVEAGMITYVEHDPRCEALLRDARALSRRGKHLEAVEALRNLPEPGSEYIPARLETVAVLMEAGRWEEAVEEADALEEELPDDPHVRGLAAATRERAEHAERLDTLLSGAVTDGLKLDEDEAPILSDITLKDALKRVGFRHVNEFCSAHGLPVNERRPVKEQAFAIIPVDIREPLETALAALGRGKRRPGTGFSLPLPGIEQVSEDESRPRPVAFQLKVSLKGVSPPVWRRLLVPPDITLHRLHEVIQRAAGWWNYRLYEFRIRGQRYGVPDEDSDWCGTEYIKSKKTLLKDVAKQGSRFTYVYDFGDNWEHEVLVEGVLPVPEPLKHAECIDGRRAFPHEDCGGIGGYDQLLQALRDPRHPDHREMRVWAGDYDPERFDKQAINSLLKRSRLSAARSGKDSRTVVSAAASENISRISPFLDVSAYPGDTEMSRMLAETGSTVPLHRVRTLVLGAIAAHRPVEQVRAQRSLPVWQREEVQALLLEEMSRESRCQCGSPL